MRVMRKKGISAIVATILIILIVVAAVAILWATLIPLIRESANIEIEDTKVSIIISKGYTVYDPEKRFAFVQVRRGTDEENVAKLNFIFIIKGESVIYETPDAPMINGEKLYSFNFSKDGIIGTPEFVSVAPVFVVGSTMTVGKVTSKVQMPIKPATVTAEDNDRATHNCVSGCGGGGGPGGPGACTNECTSGGCEGGVSYTCFDSDSDGCTEKVSGASCTGLQTCTANIGCVNTLYECGTISVSGIYLLNQSIVSTTNCIGVDADNVVIDCGSWANKVVYGNQSNGNYYGIGTDKFHTVIKNCEVYPGSTMGYTNRYGIYLYRSNGSVIENVHLTGSNGEGILFDESFNNSIDGVLANGNSFGLQIDDSHNNNFTRINASFNWMNGFFLAKGSNNRLTLITASNNSYQGVDLRYSSNNTLSFINLTGNGRMDSSRSGLAFRDGSSNNVMTNIISLDNGNGISIESNSLNNQISLSKACGNLFLDLKCNVTSTGNLGTGNIFNSSKVGNCADNNWPVLGTDYTPC